MRITAFCGKKDRLSVFNKTDQLKMLPQFYLTCFQKQLSPTQFLTLEILVGMLQIHKQVRIERLAALFPQPIKLRAVVAAGKNF